MCSRVISAGWRSPLGQPGRRFFLGFTRLGRLAWGGSTIIRCTKSRRVRLFAGSFRALPRKGMTSSEFAQRSLQRALAHPEPLVRQPLNGGSERCRGQPEIIGIDDHRHRPGHGRLRRAAPFVRLKRSRFVRFMIPRMAESCIFIRSCDGRARPAPHVTCTPARSS